MIPCFTRVGNAHGLNTLDINPCMLLDFNRLILADSARFD